MLTRSKKLLFGFVFANLLGLTALCQGTSAYDQYVYNNLTKSRDALLAQQQELQRASDDIRKQIDLLNGKLTRIDSYMRQVNQSLKDVDYALRSQKY